MTNNFLNTINKILILCVVQVLFFSCKDEDYTPVFADQAVLGKNTFIGSQNCATCHNSEFNEWENSHHDLSMQLADSVSILGNFNEAIYTSKGITYKFFKKGNEFFVNTEGVKGEYDDYKVAYAFGVYPLQQYLIEFPDGKYQCLLAAWDSENQKWYDLQPDLEIHNTEWLHWTGGSMNWNNMCADCHSTNLKKNYNQVSETYNTTYDIINVSCEACHGAGSNHVDYYSNSENYKDFMPPVLYMDKTMTPKELVQKCARCHSRRAMLTDNFDYKGHFLDHYMPSLLTEPNYELDGQIKDEVYVYGSFKQSKMYDEGVSCNDCHNPHTLSLKKAGNDLCLNCHTPNYNDYSHHFHKPGSESAQCVNCHMTGKTYMGNDYRRDHSFRVPRPDQTVDYGTPNACNNCHQDKTAEWAASFIIDKYGDVRPDHFSDELLAGYHGDLEAFYNVFSNNEYPEIARATALNRYGNNVLSETEFAKIYKYLNDLSPLVRNEAVMALSTRNSETVANSLKPLLMDSLRLIRISTANYFKSFNEGVFIEEKNKQAEKDYNNELKSNADFASGQHKIAVSFQTKGNIEKAAEAYYKALKIDNYYNISRVNLALLEYNRGNIETAEKLYLKVIEQEPNYSQPYYMLGLLYNESGEPQKSLFYLKTACEKEPKNQRAFYNYALKLQEQLLLEDSINVIEDGLTHFILDEGLLYLKLIAFLKLENISEARTLVIKLLEISPNNTNYQNILNNLSN